MNSIEQDEAIAFLQSQINDLVESLSNRIDDIDGKGARVCRCGDAPYAPVHIRGRFIIDADLKTKLRV